VNITSIDRVHPENIKAMAELAGDFEHGPQANPFPDDSMAYVVWNQAYYTREDQFGSGGIMSDQTRIEREGFSGQLCKALQLAGYHGKSPTELARGFNRQVNISVDADRMNVYPDVATGADHTAMIA
jgi:hypothetical protein